MRIRMSIIGKLTLAAISLIFLAGSANAGCVGDETGTDFGCGDTVTESCTFDENMSCSSGHGLVIGENGATINGNGYMLDGTSAGACDGLGIQRTGIYNKAHDDVVIKDLEVKNFCNGIYFKYDSEEGDRVERVIIENCNIHHNGGDTGGDNSVHGIKAIGVFDSMIKNCKIHHNTGKGDSCEGGGNGIFLKGISGFGAWNNTLIHNEIYDNRKGGFFTKMMCEVTEVSYNKLWGNGQGGIILRCKKTTTHDIHHNNASCNYGDGIFVGGPDNIIRNNVVENNKNGPYYPGIVGDGDGIDMGRSDGSYNNKLYENTICGNEDNGIEICSGVSGNTLYYNYVCENGNVDIYDGDATAGYNNTCNTTYNYDDAGATGCTYLCAGVIADFSAEPTKGAAPLTVNFIDKSKPTESIDSWFWDFGEGNTSNEQKPTHTYYTSDPYSYYNVSLTVNWSGGESKTETKPDYLLIWKSEAVPNAGFYCSPGVGTTSEPVTFTDESIGEVTSWLWDFGDGNTNTSQNPVHYYCSTGIYTVSLEVIGPGGSSKDTKFECIRVGEEGAAKRPLIDAAFFASARSDAAPLTVKFTDMSSSEGEIDSWKWNFGDGYTSNERNPTHTYNSSGIYTVSLELTNTGGAKAKETKTDYITVTAETQAIFDTGKPANPYPSIFGTHEGTIIPDRDIIVNKMYTYPCKGTGGHSEDVRIYNESGTIAEGYWNGYRGDYHNITFDTRFTLKNGTIYNYTIKTGSYPQIHHRDELKVNGGVIRCAEFIDANGRRYNDWIPAIRLEGSVEDVWSEDIRITNDTAYSRDPKIAVDSDDNVHITWRDPSGIYYTKLDNNGTTLVDDKNLTTGKFPTIAVDSNNKAHITWWDPSGVYYMKLYGNGSILVDKKVATGWNISWRYPAIALDSNDNVHITWSETAVNLTGLGVYYTKLDNNGTTLVDTKRLSNASRETSTAIAVNLYDDIWITWCECYGYYYGDHEIYYTKLDNNGSVLINNTKLTDDEDNSIYPKIAADSDNNVHITWHNFPSPPAPCQTSQETQGYLDDYIHYMKLDINGSILVTDTRIATGLFPAIAVDSNNNVHISWSGIYYTKLDSNGNPLIDKTKLTTGSQPAIAVDSNNKAHVTWYDWRDGDSEIYYKRQR